MNFTNLKKLVQEAVDEGIFACAGYAVGNKDELFVKKSVGYKTLLPHKQDVNQNTLFDIASLTKIVCTTMLAFKAIEQGKLCLSDTIEQYIDNCYDKGDITIKQLLTHTSGITSHMLLHSQNISPEQAVQTILKQPYDYQRGSMVVYSCMGYIVLGEIIENIFKNKLDTLASEMIFKPLEMNEATFNPSNDDVASTEMDAESYNCLSGVVHDENARFLGGVAGNAGVFCTLDDMIKFCSMLSKNGKGFLSNQMFEAAVTNQTKQFGENRGLGFALNGNIDSFAGDLFSKDSFGHTGFTGTSILVDKKTGIYAILLTNRVHPTRENEKIIRFRKLFHNAIWSCFEQ